MNLGLLSNNSQLGETTFDINIDGKHIKDKKPEISMKGEIANIQFKEYTYENIELDGHYNKGELDGKITLYDPNGVVEVNGSCNLTAKTPIFNFSAQVESLCPNRLNLVKGHKDASFSVDIEANFTGNSIDNLIGQININDFIYKTPEKEYSFSNLNIQSSKIDEINKLSVQSDFFNANVEGIYKYQAIPQSFTNILHKYLPDVLPSKIKFKETNNNFNIDITVLNSNLLSEVFNIPIKLYSPITVKGVVNDITQHILLEGYFPRLYYNNNYIESGMFMIGNTNEQFDGRIRLTNRKKDNAFNLSIAAKAQNNQIATTIDWGNNSATTYSGKIAATTNFARSEAAPFNLSTSINIDSTQVILNDIPWTIYPSLVTVNKKTIDIDNFLFKHNDRFLHVNGTISEIPSDTLLVNLHEINIGYIFDIANVTKDVQFEGDATGTAYAYGLDRKSVV